MKKTICVCILYSASTPLPIYTKVPVQNCEGMYKELYKKGEPGMEFEHDKTDKGQKFQTEQIV